MPIPAPRVRPAPHFPAASVGRHQATLPRVATLPAATLTDAVLIERRRTRETRATRRALLTTRRHRPHMPRRALLAVRRGPGREPTATVVTQRLPHASRPFIRLAATRAGCCSRRPARSNFRRSVWLNATRSAGVPLSKTIHAHRNGSGTDGSAAYFTTSSFNSLRSSLFSPAIPLATRTPGPHGPDRATRQR